MGDRLRAIAPAKVNLVLEVGPRRADGYHEIDTVLQSLALADTVTLEWNASGIALSGPFAAGTPADESNLAWRAASELARRCGASIAQLRIAIEKQIPPAGGLGGGASDAVAVLRLLQRRWDASDTSVLEAAAAVGSDEAYFLVGGLARAQGRGVRVTPLPDLQQHGVVLFVPDIHIERKTAQMFSLLDAHPRAARGAVEAFVAGASHRLTSADVVNDFEKVADDLFPGIGPLWADIEGRTGERVHLAGAGPTLFWIGPQDRRRAVALAAQGIACAVLATTTSARSPFL